MIVERNKGTRTRRWFEYNCS